MKTQPGNGAASYFAALLPWAALMFMGVVWGLSFTLALVAVEAGGPPLGITFWQTLVCGGLLFVYTNLRGKRLPISWRYARIYFVVAILGSAVPGSCFYFAAAHVSAGVLSITVALVPILTYFTAVVLGIERGSAIRLAGVSCGAAAIVLLVAPETSLPSRAAIPWVLLACFSALCYAGENLYLARPALADIGPVRTTCGMNLMAAAIMAPVATGSGQMFLPAFPFGVLEWSVIALAVITAIAYSMYVHVIKTAGPVFASQTGYTVTLAGVGWGILLLSESHSYWVWASLVIMLAGMALVKPRAGESGDTEVDAA